MRSIMPHTFPVPEILRDATIHAFGSSRAQQMLDELLRHRTSQYPVAQVAQDNLATSLSLVDWKKTDKKALERAIKAIPNIQLDVASRAAMSESLPWWIIPYIGGHDPKLEILVEPDGVHKKSCDLFVQNRAGHDVGPSYRPATRRRGLAVECKAIQSQNKIESAIAEARSQLEPYQSGLLILDLSVLVREHCSRLADQRFDSIYEGCTDFIKIVTDRIRTWVGRQPKVLKTVNSIAIHACTLSNRQNSAATNNAYLVYEHHCIRCLALLEGEGDPHPFVLETLKRLSNCGSCIAHYPPTDHAFVTRRNAELRVIFRANATDFDLEMVTLDRSRSVGLETPISCIKRVVSGPPSQYDQSDSDIFIGFHDSGSANDEYVRSPRLATIQQSKWQNVISSPYHPLNGSDSR